MESQPCGDIHAADLGVAARLRRECGHELRQDLQLLDAGLGGLAALLKLRLQITLLLCLQEGHSQPLILVCRNSLRVKLKWLGKLTIAAVLWLWHLIMVVGPLLPGPWCRCCTLLIQGFQPLDLLRLDTQRHQDLRGRLLHGPIIPSNIVILQLLGSFARVQRDVRVGRAADQGRHSAAEAPKEGGERPHPTSCRRGGARLT